MKLVNVVLLLLWTSSILPDTPRLLIKIPTRSRPERLYSVLDTHYSLLSKELPFHFLISCDVDDVTMNNDSVRKQLAQYEHLSLRYHNHASKVEAYNSDINEFIDNYDIVLVASDDLVPVAEAYDKIIEQKMLEHFPDYDGVLNFHDGKVGAELNTYPIIGRSYYRRFNYIFHPAYKSLFCDEELTNIARILKKEACSDTVLLRHHHPVWGLGNWDALYRKNEALDSHDRQVYYRRRAEQYELSEELIAASCTKKWSILICTLDERKEKFDYLSTRLMTQIVEEGLEDEVEVLYFLDNRKYSVGYKRNELLQRSNGTYVCFVDDDDDVAEDYIRRIYDALQKNPDCVELEGIITFKGEHPHRFVHSLKYDSYFEKEGVYYRCPNHLNPIKRAIACQFRYPDKNFSEDSDWTFKLAAAKLLKTEVSTEEPLYFYNYSVDYYSLYQRS